jgi:hypothetical protein
MAGVNARPKALELPEPARRVGYSYVHVRISLAERAEENHAHQMAGTLDVPPHGGLEAGRNRSLRSVSEEPPDQVRLPAHRGDRRIASEHDSEAGTQRGANTIFCFTLDGVRCCHLGDFGPSSLRPEQRDAIGEVDVLFVPVGAGPTVDGDQAAEIVSQLEPAVVVPMHYATDAVDFLEEPDRFLGAVSGRVQRVEANEVEAQDYLGTGDGPAVIMLSLSG